MTDTHCLPSGAPGTGELLVNPITAQNTTTNDPGVGNRRGIIVNIHGLNDSGQLPIPQTVPNFTFAGLSEQFGDFVTAVVADGWIHLFPVYQDDFYSPPPNGATGVQIDVSNDSGHGARYLASTLHWWDHMLNYIGQTYGAGHPIICMGWSWGASKTLWIAANRQSSIIGFIAHEPACLPENAVVGVTGWGATNFSGIDLPSTYLTAANAVSPLPPGIIGYGTNDPAVGWQNPGVGLPTNNTDAILTACSGASMPVTRRSTADTHEFTGTPQGAGNDAAAYAAWIVSTLDPSCPVSF